MLDTVNSSGKIFISHTVRVPYILKPLNSIISVMRKTWPEILIIATDKQVLSGKFVLRFAVGAPLTEESHVKAAWKVLQDQATILLTEVCFIEIFSASLSLTKVPLAFIILVLFHAVVCWET